MVRLHRFSPARFTREIALVASLVVCGTGVAVAASASGGGARVGAASVAARDARALTALLTAASRATEVEPPTTSRALVAVSAAEVWAGRRSVKPVDEPALQRPARVGDWLHRMTFEERSHLYRRLATQVRYGEPVVVLGTRGDISKIRIPDQTGGMFPDGIIGWIASRQLAPEPATWGGWQREATVTAKSVQLRSTAGPVRLSYATTLPVLQVGAHRVVVAAAGSAKAGTLPRRAVSIHAINAPAIRPSGQQVLDQARRFLGLPYLWAGMTSWGFDCSGLTSTVYSMLGIRLPRDAADQSHIGRQIPRGQLRPGDLVFFSHGPRHGGIHHVAIYAGHGFVLQSPYTGARIQLTRLRGSYLNREYWSATRPLS